MSYLDSTTASGSSGTPSVAVPTGGGALAADDIVIVAIGVDNSSAAVDPADLPAGFVELREVSVTLDGQRAWVGYKRLTASDTGSYTFGSIAPASPNWVCQAIAFRGRHTTNAPVASADSVSNSGNTNPVSVNATTVTAVASDDLVFISVPDVNTNNAGNGHTPPSTYTEAEDAENGFANLSLAYKENVGAGATGTITGTFALSSGTSGWAAYLVRIPAAAAGGTTTTKVMEDTLAITDGLVNWALRSRVGSDSTSITDGFVAGTQRPRTNSDSMTVSDNLVSGVRRGAVMTDSLTVSDSTTSWIHRRRTGEDFLVIADGLVTWRILRRTLEDSIDIIDGLVKSVSSGGGGGIVYTKVVGDAIEVIDDIGNRWTRRYSRLTDQVDLADELLHSTLRFRQASDAIALADALVNWCRRGRFMADAIEVTDGIVRMWRMRRIIEDQVPVLDEVLKSYLPSSIYDVRIRLGAEAGPVVGSRNEIRLGVATDVPVLGGYN